MAFTYSGEQVDLGFGRGWLNRPAANSIRRIDRQIGHPMQITEAGRTWARQNEHYQRYLRNGSPIALSPNAPSIHQKGGAIDSNEAQRIVAVLEEHGWRRTVYRWVKGKWTLVEPWHFEYFTHLDKHLNDRHDDEGNDMNATQAAQLDAVYKAIFGANNGPTGVGGVPIVWRNLYGDEQKSELGILSLLATQVYRSNPDGSLRGISQLQDNADTNTMVRELLGRPAASVDVKALAPELVAGLRPVLAGMIQGMSPEDLAAVAKVVNDEQDRRDREGRES